MKVVTQNIKIELENDEKATLNKARAILDDFLETMKDNHCSNAYFEDFNVEYTVSEIRNAFSLIDVLGGENPIIE